MAHYSLCTVKHEFRWEIGDEWCVYVCAGLVRRMKVVVVVVPHSAVPNGLNEHSLPRTALSDIEQLVGLTGRRRRRFDGTWSRSSGR